MNKVLDVFMCGGTFSWKNVKVMEYTVLHYFASLLLNNLRLNNFKQVVDS